ncbi:MAG: HEPN domain-containing protein [Desulfovibrionales bacterium]|nr:MAG: HEPN domain-containing protein [Desulfovibrionales bacterium]
MTKELAKAWLFSAPADLKSIGYIIHDEFLSHIVAFHAQQCVEKSFKAILENSQKRVPKEHSTLKLYGMIQPEIQMDLDMDILTDLDDLYIDARYPGDFGLLPHGKPSREEAREFMMFAQEIFETISNHVGA